MRLLRVQLICVAIMAICGASLAEELERPQLRLVPYPQKIKYANGDFTPEKQLRLTCNKAGKELARVAETCARDLTDIGFSASHGKKTPANKATVIKLEIVNDKNLGKEGYRLAIASDISISAATVEGLFWGTRTLLQILHAGPRKTVPKLTITDRPEFEYRGLMIDNARKFHSMDFHIKTIKRLASFKLNRYQIHFSDHQSYTLPSVTFPNLPTKDRHYTAKQIEKLVAVAKQYHVTIVPEIDVPGHSAALTRGIKNLGCTNTPAGRTARKLCIGREETYVVLEKLFAEIMEMIPGEYWHLGADEVRYDGRNCTACAGRMKKEKLKEGGQLFHYFINRMHGMVKLKGRKMLVWEGFSPTLAPLVNKDIIVCPFDVKHRGHMPSNYFSAGYKVLNTAWTPLYVADRIYMTTPEVIARWSPYMFGAGRSPQPFAYWKKFKPEDYRGKIIGAQMCSWSIEEKAEEGLLFGTGPGFHNYGRPGPRLQIMAERVWTGSGTTAKSLLQRVGADYWNN
jgi:hexosaminidase